MRDKLLTYAIVASIVVHLVLLGIVGKTSAAKPISVDELKVVQVDLIKTPDQLELREEKPDAPKSKVEQPEPARTPYVPPVAKMVTTPSPQQKKKREKQQTPPRTFTRNPRPTPSPHTSSATVAKAPGDPGGALGGVTSRNGEDMGHTGSGKTPVGWVPGSDTGKGIGSGSGAGKGRPDPVPDARPGPGLEPAPEPPPVIVSVTVCAVSGQRPGPNCDKKQSRSFREGSEPRSACTVCKPPEPKHVSTLADRSEPELIKDSQVKLPPLDESGNFVVRIRYTVNTNGSVSDVEITDSSGVPAIDRAVREAAVKMRYKPAVQNGDPRSVKIKRKYRIKI